MTYALTTNLPGFTHKRVKKGGVETVVGETVSGKWEHRFSSRDVPNPLVIYEYKYDTLNTGYVCKGLHAQREQPFSFYSLLVADMTLLADKPQITTGIVS